MFEFFKKIFRPAAKSVVVPSVEVPVKEEVTVSEQITDTVTQAPTKRGRKPKVTETVTPPAAPKKPRKPRSKA